MPKKSYTSRSKISAIVHISDTEWSMGFSRSGVDTFTARVWLWTDELR